MRNWKDEIKNNNIEYVNDINKLKYIIKKYNLLYIARCSKTKTGKDKAIPKDFYVSQLNLNFYKTMEANNFYYGILSDKYGIHFCDEYLDFYDIHPSQLTMKDKINLGTIIKNKSIEKNFNAILFYNNSPLLSKPYFEMLHVTGLPIYYISKLNLFNQLKKNTLF